MRSGHTTLSIAIAIDETRVNCHYKDTVSCYTQQLWASLIHDSGSYL